MVNAYNDIDIDQIYEKVQSHDPKFDRDRESGQTYKERIYYFKLARNLEEEKEFDAMNINAYILFNPRYLYCIELETYSWVCEPIPITNLGFIQLSLTNPVGAILKLKKQ